jgi:single-strand DNA-binding protein
MQKFIFSGNLTKDPVIDYGRESGKPFTKITVAVQRKRDREKSDFFNVTIFGNQAERAADFLEKGSKVLVEGEVNIDSKNGKYYTNVLADFVEFLTYKRRSNDSNANTSNSAAERYKRQSEQNSRYSSNNDKNPLTENDQFPPGSEVYNDFKDEDTPF